MKQTAVEWLFDHLVPHLDWSKVEDRELFRKLKSEAKEMEKEQIMKTARQCHFEGVRQSAKTSQEYIDYSEQYYNERYGGKNEI